MNRYVAISIVLAAACTNNTSSGDQDGIDVGPSVAPRLAKLSYATFGKDVGDAQMRALPDQRLEVAIAQGGDTLQRATPWQGARPIPGGGIATDMRIAPDGVLETAGEHPEALAELVESLPAINARLKLGETYEAGAPSQAYLDKAFEEGKVVLWQVTRNTPREIHVLGDAKLIALDVVGYNRGYERDEITKQIKESKMGVSFRTRTDLYFTPETGWVVLRMRRLNRAVNPNVETAAFSELTAGKHADFTACLQGITATELTNATRADFPACP